MRIVDGNAQPQCSATAYGGYGAAASGIRERSKPVQSKEQADAALASIALNSNAATTHHVYCYAVASRAPEVQKNFGLLHRATSQENSCVAVAPLATSQENSCVAFAPLAKSQEKSCVAIAPPATSPRFATTRVHRFKDRVTDCTRMHTLASRARERITVTARIASPSALNCTRHARDKLFTSRAPPARDDLLATSVHSLSAACDAVAPLVSACAHSTSLVLAPSPSRAVSLSRSPLPAPFPARAAEWPEFDSVPPRWWSPSQSRARVTVSRERVADAPTRRLAASASYRRSTHHLNYSLIVLCTL